MVVIDASIANKLLLPLEEGHEATRRVFQRHIENKERIVVPDLLFYEVANTLATKKNIPLPLINKSLDQLYSAHLGVVSFSEKQMKAAATLARENMASVYDATYAVLAQEKHCDLITADKKFAKQVNLPFVKILVS